MSRIEISNLTTTENNSVATDSFFLELQATDTAQVFGGNGHGGYYGGNDDYNCGNDGHGKGRGNGRGNGRGKGYGNGYYCCD